MRDGWGRVCQRLVSVVLICYLITGDFAMLLNAGMTAKQALVYNCVSSVLCMLGMIFGVVVGNITSATSWIFALIAGLFLYVALVDMVISCLILSICYRTFFRLLWKTGLMSSALDSEVIGPLMPLS